MKSIAFFMHNFTGGGAEKVTINLANELARRGYKISFLVIDRSGVLESKVDKNIEIINFNIGRANKVIKNISNIFKLKKEIEFKKYKYFISVTAPMNLILSIANFLSKDRVKAYGTIHSMISLEDRKYKKLRYKLLKYFDKYIEKTICVSKEAEEDYINTIGVNENKVITIYNPVIYDKIFQLQEEKCNHKWLNAKREYKVVIAAGRLNEAKNFEMLLESIQLVKKERDIRLIILGEGELRKELEEKIENLNLKDNVDLYGFTENPYKFFSKGDLFVLSSRREGLPTVLIEALSCGCKIVSTNCKSGPKEILEDGKYGELVEVGNVKEFSKAIIKKLDEDVDKNLLVNRALDFTIEKSLKEYIKLIN